MKRWTFPLFALALSACTTASQDRIDLILTGGKIFTADPQHPAAEAVAITGERIAAVGTAAQIATLASSNTRIIDLGGKTVVPGFNDAHFHTSTPPQIRAVELGTMEPAFSAVEEALRNAAANTPPEVWLDAVVGGSALDDARANRDTLDAISTRHPIQVHSWAGHGSIYNSRALQLLGFRDNEPDPPGGFFGRDASGRINGVANEYAGYLAHRRFNGLATRESAVQQLAAAAQMAARWGITSIQEMSTAHRADEQAALLVEAKVPQRWRVIRFPLTIASGWQSTEGGPPAGGRVRIHGTKWILDGTPVERLAFMRDSYQDLPGWKGRLNFSPNTITRLLRESSAGGEQVLFHAVGDGAIEALLQAMESAGGAAVWRDRRVRIEHADFLSPHQIERAHNLGVVIVHNPLHSLPEMMHARYTPEVVGRTQSLRRFVKAGLPVAIGSDGPNNPFLNLMLAVVHPANPAEAMTLEEAVIAYTRGAAYAELAEADKGMLRQGMLADLAVLSADIFTMPLQQLPTVESVLTIIGGKIIHETK